MEKKERTTIYLTKKKCLALRKLALDRGVSMTKLIEQKIDELLKEKEGE